MLRQAILDIINNPNAPAIGELRPNHDNVHHYYNRIVNAVTEARPTGPTPEYLRELEEEMLAIKAERDHLLAACEDALPSIVTFKKEHIEDGDDLAAFCLSSIESHMRAAIAAAKGTES